jgi:hypothetical protein
MKARRGATAVPADGSAVFPATERSLLGPNHPGIKGKQSLTKKRKKNGKLRRRKAAGFH